MTAVLVTASQAKVHMGVTSTGDDDLIQTYVNAVEDLFVKRSRPGRPFVTAATGRSEVYPGTGTELLVLNYPLATGTAITSLLIGHDSSNPDETLTATDIDQISYGSTSRSVYRTDGGTFGKHTEPRVVHITYNHGADSNDLAALAIKRVVAQVYRQRGSEDAKSETMPDGYSRTISSLADEDPIWRQAVDSEFAPEFV